MKLLFELFFSFLQVGAFSFGGGYACIPMIQEQVVDLHGWLSITEFTDLVTISQMTPGPIAINAATFVGIKIAGVAGAACATIGCILPSCILVTIFAWAYVKYRKIKVLQKVLSSLRPAVVAMIAASGVVLLISSIWHGAQVPDGGIGNVDFVAVVLFVGAFAALRKKADPVLVMVLAGIANVVISLI